MGEQMTKYWWTDEHGAEHGPIGIQALVQLRSDGKLESTSLVRVEGGAVAPLYEHDLTAEIERAGRREVRLMFVVLATALGAFVSLFVAIFATAPITVLALLAFLTAAASLAVLAGRHRQLGLSFTAILIPAAVGMMATVQHPVLLEPLASTFCEPGESLVSASARTADPARWADPTASEVTSIWTACASPTESRQTYLPMFTHGLVLFVLLILANRVGRFALAVEA